MAGMRQGCGTRLKAEAPACGCRVAQALPAYGYQQACLAGSVHTLCPFGSSPWVGCHGSTRRFWT